MKIIHWKFCLAAITLSIHLIENQPFGIGSVLMKMYYTLAWDHATMPRLGKKVRVRDELKTGYGDPTYSTTLIEHPKNTV